MQLRKMWETVCAYYMQNPDCPKVLTSRKPKYAIPRQLYCYIASEIGFTLSDVGHQIGKDHSTVIHSRKVIKNYLETDKKQAIIIQDCVKFVMSEMQDDHLMTMKLAKRILHYAGKKSPYPKQYAKQYIAKKINKLKVVYGML